MSGPCALYLVSWRSFW